MTNPTRFGNTLIIANPSAQSGAARAVAERLQRFLSLYLHDSGSFTLTWTERPRHATELAEQAAAFDTVIALGGDGVIHETANGLMHLNRAERPALGILPVGSGNDFAQTLGIRDFSGENFSALLSCEKRSFDVGRIDYARRIAPDLVCSTEYFVETLSVGIDAAIGLGTYDLRKKTGLTGSALYTLSGLEQFGLRYRSFDMHVSFDDEPRMHIKPLIMAVQLGPTYGSGFKVCPNADPADGLFDVCYAIGPIPRALALPIFLSAKHGGHVDKRPIRMRRCTRASYTFGSDDYPIQADGERITASRMNVSILPAELTVLVPHAE